MFGWKLKGTQVFISGNLLSFTKLGLVFILYYPFSIFPLMKFLTQKFRWRSICASKKNKKMETIFPPHSSLTQWARQACASNQHTLLPAEIVLLAHMHSVKKFPEFHEVFYGTCFSKSLWQSRERGIIPTECMRISLWNVQEDWSRGMK